ncbi:circadian clock KaiB family protein [Muricoccus vinaceus]|uniref:Circadian clock KaiB family protein n=1 Tax=Muricoccus vinaceus TaxID=424704 RepID=A0ABV6IWG3_9PROT
MSEARPGPVEEPTYRLRLFVAGNTVRSRLAIENLRLFCTKYLAGRFDLEVVDIHQQPELAERNQIVAAPTLLRMEPLPMRRIVGDLSQTERLLRGLDVVPTPGEVAP